MSRELERRRQTEAWIAWVRVGAVAFAILNVGLITQGYPPGYALWAWIVTAVLGAGALALFWLCRRRLSPGALARLGLVALAFDTAVVYAYMEIYTFEPGTPSRALLYLPVVEAALRYGILGGVALPLVTAPFLALVELWRADHYAPPSYDLDFVVLPAGLEIIIGLIVGWLVVRLRGETAVAESRAVEAEGLRDQLGRRADQLQAVNRCARALASSLDQEEALERFRREVEGVVDFDHLAIVLVEDGRARVLATAGRGPVADPPVERSVLEEALAGGAAVVRENRSRVVAPLAHGQRVLGVLSVGRAQPAAFSREDVDLVSMLARQVAAAVENIRLFEAEREAVRELRRLSALRADFVSLVSHELRAPMAAVLGCAATLRQRWRELSPDQRESFLALIEEETSRLSTLVSDVLDTSRIEAGSFPHAFADVDLAEILREAAGLVDVGQDEVRVKVSTASRLPPVRGDRLRQLLMNLVSNAVKYTVAGDEVEVSAATEDGAVAVRVRDHGPGIPLEEQKLIFEKFGRASRGGKAKPGAGLGLFIARSIAEAHGGSLEVSSEPGTGATFTFRLPLGVSAS